jgi:redox-sensitive bicupin YhaK (pirin superfamily)
MERRDFLTIAGAASVGAACEPLPSQEAALLDLVDRPVALRTLGSSHGPITRLVSPGDIGEDLKPFVFLDRFELRTGGAAPNFGWHPHSGIATVTYIFQGAATYEETNGSKGVIRAGGIEWMRASGGVWHTGGGLPGETIRGFQLWVAMPPELENAQSESAYIDPAEVPTVGPARVILGQYGEAKSRVPAPEGLTYLAVSLKAGERWTYAPTSGHNVAWLAVHVGALTLPAARQGELVVFEEGSGAIVIEAKVDTDLVIGSALKHEHPLVLGRYSVHTSRAALQQGEANIARMGREFRSQGRFG